MGKVKVKAKDGNVIFQSQNSPEYGYIRLEQDTIEINQKGWLKSVKRSTLLKGLMKDLVAAGYKDGTELPGKIIVVEQLTPFNPENPDRNLKIAGKTGVVCRLDDQPIYRETFYTTDIYAFDNLISHTNSEEIRDVMEAQSQLDLLPEEVAYDIEGAVL